MKVIETYPVAITLPNLMEQSHYDTKPIAVEDDGTFRWIQIPQIGKVPDAIQWLSDNDALSCLMSMTPDILDNEHVFRQMVGASDQSTIVVLFDAQRGHPQAKALVESCNLYRKAIWHFTDLGKATLFKLTFGGEA
ncbi:hypothetical protein AX777_05985 [Sphingobium yanoikuyae]|uniref:Uncharacterized protein n=1 Tax=Sphingobium yanoikuyae TaxID=13690 RepID=A0A177JPF7_SPHYA|nr:hypothetical protein [Sphingobium yanoikuyae]OAH42787.1 hypothetical protein AX777_05985 [Sphingobium yanoikuyae]